MVAVCVIQKCMHLLDSYCAIQAGAYTFDTTKFDPQTVVVISCLVTWEFGGRQISGDLQVSMPLKGEMSPQRHVSSKDVNMAVKHALQGARASPRRGSNLYKLN